MPDSPLLRCIRPAIACMAGYAPGEQVNDTHVLKLNTNECSYPPSPRVFEAIRDACTPDRLRKYPQPHGDTFRHAAAEALGVDPDGILIGNGSDDILTVLTRTFVPEGGTMASPTPSYTLYSSLAQIQGAAMELVPFTADWQLPEPWPVPDAHLTFLPNPNSPSGTVVGHDAMERLASQLAGPLVLDEAYAEFAERDGLALLGKVPNLVISRTLSKSAALAGIRFGYALADPAVVRELNKVKDSYNCDVLSLAAATAAIRDRDYYRGIRAEILQSRESLAGSLRGLGFTVTPSQANFVWCEHPEREPRPIYEALKARNVLVRLMSYPRMQGLRITVGTPAECERLLAELRGVV